MNFPTEPKDNERFRLELLQEAERSKKSKLDILKLCKKDPIFFCNFFCWTLDPRLANPHLPFILYPRQTELFKKMDECLLRANKGEHINLLTDKPRGVGVSYTIMVWILHKFLFSDFSALVGSRKEDLVDKTGSTSSLFHKLDYNLAKLPIWMTGGYDKTKHRANMILKHPTLDSVIDGESSNADFGKGGRYSVIIFDELGAWMEARSAWESSGESTNFRIGVSTPPEAGRDSHWYKLLSGQRGRIENFEFNWDDVPTRDEKWLEDARETKSEEEFAREVMKSFAGTTEGKVYARDMRLVRLSAVDYNPKLPLFVSWDDGGDGTALIWWQKDFSTGQLYIIDCYQESNRAVEYFVPFFGHDIPSIISPIDGANSTPEYDSYALEKIKLHRSWRRDTIHYGDPSINQTRNNVGLSSFDILAQKYGIVVNSQNWNSKEFGKRNWKDIRDITRTKFRRIEINEKRCEMLIYAMRNARYPKVKENSQATSVPLKPIHDPSTAHLRASFEFFCDNEPENHFMDDREEEEDESFDKFKIF